MTLQLNVEREGTNEKRVQIINPDMQRICQREGKRTITVSLRVEAQWGENDFMR